MLQWDQQRVTKVRWHVSVWQLHRVGEGEGRMGCHVHTNKAQALAPLGLCVRLVGRERRTWHSPSIAQQWLRVRSAWVSRGGLSGNGQLVRRQGPQPCAGRLGRTWQHNHSFDLDCHDFIMIIPWISWRSDGARAAPAAQVTHTLSVETKGANYYLLTSLPLGYDTAGMTRRSSSKTPARWAPRQSSTWSVAGALGGNGGWMAR